MIWGSISSKGHGELRFMPKGTTINGIVYLNLLKEKLANFMTIHDTTYFQQDGALCHKTKAVKAWIEKPGYQLLAPWPGSLPDLNPIENCWVTMKKQVTKLNIKLVWTNYITPEYSQSLIHSMPRRIQCVLSKKGGHSKY